MARATAFRPSAHRPLSGVAAHAGIQRPMQTRMQPVSSGAPMQPMQPMQSLAWRPSVATAATGGQAEGEPVRKKSSRYRGVSWETGRSVWKAYLWNPQTKRQQTIGYYASEEDAARAYDCAAGPDSKKINFPGELISEPPVSLGDQRKERETSRFFGVSSKGKAWQAQLWNRETKGLQHIGTFASEEDAARAYDCAAVELYGPDFKKLNFPGEVISEAPVSRGDKRRERKS
jgi:hypothetical protein